MIYFTIGVWITISNLIPANISHSPSIRNYLLAVTWPMINYPSRFHTVILGYYYHLTFHGLNIITTFVLMHTNPWEYECFAEVFLAVTQKELPERIIRSSKSIIDSPLLLASYSLQMLNCYCSHVHLSLAHTTSI